MISKVQRRYMSPVNKADEQTFWPMHLGIGIFALLAILAATLVAAAFATTEYERIPSPDGRFIAVVEYRTWRSFVPMPIGSSGDKPGFVTIYSREGRSLGRAQLPMVWWARDLEWKNETVEIRMVAIWDLAKGTVEDFSQ